VTQRRETTQSNYGEIPPHRHWGLGLLLAGLVVFLVVAFLVATLVHPYYYPGTMSYYDGWWFFPFGFFFFIFIVFFVGRLIFWPWGWRRNYWYRHDEAYYILRQRYARGEITKDQYDQMMRDLEQHR
jgi:putative membrane protein